MKWTDDQNNAIETKNKNILLSAAAGSGKTSVLVERIIRLIIEEKVNIDEMLIITFTKAAAGEMRERIQKALSKKAREEDVDINFLTRQINMISNANISTIHSFCMEVIKKNFHMINLDPSFRIIDETEKKLLFSEVLEEILEEEYKKSHPNFISLVESYTSNRDDEGLKNIIEDVYTFIMSKPNPFEWLDKNIEKLNISENDLNNHQWIDELKDLMDFEMNSLLNMAKNALQLSKKPGGPMEYSEAIKEDLQNIKNIKKALKNDIGNFFDQIEDISFSRFSRISGDRKKEVDPSLKKNVSEIRKNYKKDLRKFKEILGGKSLDDAINDLKEIYPLMDYLYKIIIKFHEKFQNEKFERNAIDFNDLEHISLKLLNDKEISNYYKNKFEYIFVDEYQDTNIIQDSIVNKIKSDDNLFLVGDIKQSIYKFRLADPTLFLDKYHEFKNKKDSSKRIDLYKNFRSRKEILDGINYIFKHLMSEEFGEIEYNEDTFLNPGLEFKDVENPNIEINILSTDDKELDIDEEIMDMKNSELEARAIVSRIRKILGKSTYDRDLGDKREITYKDIVILMRATARWGTKFEEIFMEEGLPLYYEGGNGYLDTLEIKIFLNLLRVIDNKKQDVPLLSVMRSPIGNFDINEIIEIRRNDKKGTFHESLEEYVDEHDDELSEKIKRFIEQLNQWNELSKIKDIDEFIWILLNETNFLNYVSSMPGGNIREGNLKLLIERAKKFTDTSITGLFNFIHFVEKMDKFSADLDTANVIGENENVVRLMSIHKSKGLEFPVVIIARSFRKIQSQNFSNDVIMHKELGLGPRFIDYNKRVRSETIPRVLIKKKIKYEDLAEEMRILYVAMTRSIDKLILFGSYSYNINKKIRQWTMTNSKQNVVNLNTYIDWIMSIISNDESTKKLYNYIDKPFNVNDTINMFDINFYNLEDLEDMVIKNRDYKTDFKNKLVNNEFDVKDDNFYEFVDNRFKRDYKIKRRSIPTKISVTDFTDVAENDISKLSKDKYIPKLIEKPKFLESKEGLSSIEIGNLYHYIMEKIDLDKVSLKEIEHQIEVFNQKGYITDDEIEYVDKNKIHKFFQSDLGKRMLKSHKVKREVPFVYREKIKDNNFLIQGIIDCYFEEDDGIVLVDYKTDKLNSNNRKQTIVHHKKQLDMYEKALSKITDKNVKEKYLYFFNNNEYYDV